MSKKYYLRIITCIILLPIAENALSQNVGINNTNPLSTLDVSGSIASSIRTVTASTTLTATDATVLASPGITLTLPSSASVNRRELLIVYNGAYAGSGITIKPAGTDHIVSNGISYSSASGITLSIGSLDIQTDGSGNWYCTINNGAQGGNNWLITGNAGSTSSQFVGTTDNIGLGIRTNNTQRIHIDSLGRVGIGSNSIGAFDPSNPEELLVDYGGNASGTVANFTGSRDDYVQINIQNKNSGTNASTDYVATADNGSDSSYYVDMGINSSNYTPSVDNFGGPDDGYLYTYARNLVVGTDAAGSDLIFLIAGGSIKNNTAMRMVAPSRNIVIGKGEGTNFPVGNIIRGPNATTFVSNIPGGSLTLQGGSSSGTAAGANLYLYGGSSTSGAGGSVNVNNSANYATNINTGTSTSDVTIGNSGDNIIFPKFSTVGGILYTSANTGTLNGTTQMIWDNTNSRLGIGITVPTTTLQVNGTASLGSASATTGILSLLNSTNANTIGLQSGTTTASYSLVLPAAIGTANQALTISSISGTTATLGWVTPGSGSNWSLTGNSGTTTGTNFLGTTDGQALEFKVNSAVAGYLGLSGSSYATSLGVGASGAATAFESTAIGAGAQATGSNASIAIGYNALANTQDDIAIGESAQAKSNNEAIAIGHNTVASSFESTALGAAATASTNNQTLAVGYAATATGFQATAIGNAASATGQNATSIGNGATTSQANAIILGNTSASVGVHTSTPGANLDVNGTFRLGSNTTSTVLNNIIKTNFTTNLGTLTAGTVYTFTATVTGVTTNASVALNPRVNLSTGVFILWVRASAANTITFAVANLGTTVAQGSVTFDICAVQ